MDLTPYVASLRDDLAAAAAVGDEATTRAGTTLAAALEPAVRLALMNALSDLAGEVSEALGDRTVSLRLSGREVKSSSTPPPTEPTASSPAPRRRPSPAPPAAVRAGPHHASPPPGPGFGEAFGGFGGRASADGADPTPPTSRG